MKKFSSIIFSMLVLAFYATTIHAAGSAYVQLEEAMEVEKLDFSFDSKTSTGVIVGKVCDQCEEVTVTITPTTKAYKGSNEISLVRIQTRRDKEAVVFFNKNTKNVTRIKW